MPTGLHDTNRLHIHLDPVGGAAGDMFVAAILDALPQLWDRVSADVASVLPDSVGTAETAPRMTSGLCALGFRLVLAQGADARRHSEETTYAAMRALLNIATLSPGTREAAGAILHRIAKAEAQVHKIAIDKVHFHEIADWDSLLDITAAGSICAALSGASWSLSPLPLGGGRVQTAHGQLPVPAPATAAILEGFKWHDDGIGGERVTPTGAAILAHVTGGEHGTNPGGILHATGVGAGTRQLQDAPNILRAMVFEEKLGQRLFGQDRIVQLACDLDDMTGEEIGAAVDHLRAQEGVVDVVLLAAQGKKSRPMTRMEVLVTEVLSDQVAHAMFTYTSTLGLRRSQIDRLVLPRVVEDGPDGMRRKRTWRPDGQETLKVESDALSDHSALVIRREKARYAETE